MKKILLALGLTAMFGLAQAQSSVTLYGILDQSYYVDSSSSSAVRSQNGMSSQTASTSRFGVKGSEDLGSGNKANFVLESQLNMSNGAVGSSTSGAAQTTSATSEVFNRQANLSLSNAETGELKLGRQYALTWESAISADAIGINSLGLANYFSNASQLYGTNNITGQNASTYIAGAAAGGTTPTLYVNGISYTTPSYAGVTAKLFTSPGSGSTTTQNTAGMRSGSLNYAGTGVVSGLNAVFAYDVIDSTTGGATAQNRSVLGANYTWNRFKFSASRSYIQYYTGLNGSTVYGDNTLINSFGVKYQVTTPVWVGVEYSTAADKNVTANKSATVGLAAGYDLSKRTNVYALVGQTNNSGQAAMTPLYGSSATGNAGVANVAYAVGLRHAF